PYAQIKRSVLEEMLAISPVVTPLGKSLTKVSEIEETIDGNLEPISQKLEGWTCEFKSAFPIKKTKTNNIIGIIEGEGPNADETIVIGAHYDHLGMGAYGSRAGGRREIHNGADDNATGTAAVIELARRFNKRDKKPGRRLVFVCFTAEEMGLLGAIHYCENPIFPLESTAAMVNFDMIGWLRNEKLTLYNWNTSPQLDPIFEAANENLGFDLNKPTQAFGGSDHLPFNQRGVPNMFIHTGTNPVYHTPEDDFEAINCEGALRVIDYSERVVDLLAELEKKPSFGKPKPFRLGVMLDDENDIVSIGGITEGSIAEKAGLQKDDVILDIDGVKMTKRRDVTKVIRRDVGKTVKIKLKRGDAEVILNVELKRPE
ncbi:MAG: M20/M25/M40 family metallo-hydrolase, partial [Mariniblastus sp.]|nr:M20/M25/M40 family metallo-hydrolase [Mariniblastus sp.]